MGGGGSIYAVDYIIRRIDNTWYWEGYDRIKGNGEQTKEEAYTNMALVMEEFLPLSGTRVWNVMPSSVVIFHWESMGYVYRYFEGKAGCLYTARFYRMIC